MDLNYFAFYSEASLVCVVIFAMLIFQNNSYGTRTERENWFVRTGIILIPAIVSVVVMVVAYVINPLFWINEECILNDLYYPFMVTVPSLYVFSSTVISLRNMRRTDVREDRKLYHLIAIYPLSIVTFGLLQTFALNAPLFCFGCTLMMLFFYIQSLQMLISVDSLTKLNNRGQINRYMERIRYSENDTCCVCMIDIDRFKAINDRYGHAEGDRALTLMADALRRTADKAGVPVFIGRYGGDEFTMIVRSVKDDIAMDGLISLFRETLKEKGSVLHYPLEASVGYSFLNGADDTGEACLKRADKKLYLDKRQNKK